MSNKKFYKDIMSNVQPSEKSVERIFDMTIDKKANKGLVFKRLATAALALAILVGSGIGINSLNNSKNQYVSPAGYSIGGIMTVEAKNELKGGTNADGRYDWGYRIYAKDITGLSKEEIETEKENLAKLYICSGDKEILEKEEHDFDEFTLNDTIKNNIHVNNNIIYATERGTVEQALTLCGIDDPSNVKEIKVSNTSKYGQLIINAVDLYYKENDKGEYIFDGKDVDTALTCIEGHSKSISGERYEQCRIIENPSIKKYSKESFNKKSPVYGLELSTGKVFYFDYKFTNEFYDMLGQNPSFNLTNYKDEITITVEFKNGKVAKNVIDVTMDSKGKTYCSLNTYSLN